MYRLLAAITVTALLSGCTMFEPDPAPPTNDFCRIYTPISDSKTDTPATRKQVLERNARYECVCLKNCPKGTPVSDMGLPLIVAQSGVPPWPHPQPDWPAVGYPAATVNITLSGSRTWQQGYRQMTITRQ